MLSIAAGTASHLPVKRRSKLRGKCSRLIVVALAALRCVRAGVLQNTSGAVTAIAARSTSW